jgi:hypothetical protein
VWFVRASGDFVEERSYGTFFRVERGEFVLPEIWEEWVRSARFVLVRNESGVLGPSSL